MAEGDAIPIVAVSPHVDTPDVSQDNFLNKKSIPDDLNLCTESDSFQVQCKEIPALNEVIENNSDKIKVPSEEEHKIITISTSSPQPEKVKINPGLHVSAKKLTALFKQFKYQDIVPERSQITKCSSFKTRRTSPFTTGGRKSVR